mmetsp:Transcript_6647/g.14414  ORF Transcript_6647/g.14414 Transcript_6647/m.14414 type:complete len:230 (-) Transcript_6647:231-920(-)
MQESAVGSDDGFQYFLYRPVVVLLLLQALGEGSKLFGRKHRVVSGSDGLFRFPQNDTSVDGNSQKFRIIGEGHHDGVGGSSLSRQQRTRGFGSTAAAAAEKKAEKARAFGCLHLLNVQSNGDGNVRDPVQISPRGPRHDHGLVAGQGFEENRFFFATHVFVFPATVVPRANRHRNPDPGRVRHGNLRLHVPPRNFPQDQPTRLGIQRVQMNRVAILPVRAAQGQERRGV